MLTVSAHFEWVFTIHSSFPLYVKPEISFKATLSCRLEYNSIFKCCVFFKRAKTKAKLEMEFSRMQITGEIHSKTTST